MKKSFTIYLFLIFPFAVHGQFMPDFIKEKKLISYITAQGQFTNFQNLNSSFEAAGIPGTRRINFGVGSGVKFKSNHYSLGVEIMPFASPWPNNNDQVMVNTSFYQLYGNLDVFKVGSVNFYTHLGLGYFATRVSAESELEEASLEEIFQTRGLGVTLRNNTPLVNLGVGVDLLHGKENKSFLTLVVGYCLGLREGEWTSKNIDITDAPSDKLGYFYIQLQLSRIRVL